jgi:hypothetical protein
MANSNKRTVKLSMSRPYPSWKHGYLRIALMQPAAWLEQSITNPSQAMIATPISIKLQAIALRRIKSGSV